MQDKDYIAIFLKLSINKNIKCNNFLTFCNYYTLITKRIQITSEARSFKGNKKYVKIPNIKESKVI